MEMPTIVVTATRQAREINSVPSVVYRVDAPAMAENNGARTTPDLAKGIPSVSVQKTSYGQGSPYVRGFTGFRNLYLVDGIRLNNSVFRDGPNQYWNTVDPLSLDRCEMVMGPASVLYGSDAIGGTLNAMPVEPPSGKNGEIWRTRLFYRGSTAEESNSGRIQTGGRPTDWIGFIGGISLKQFGDLHGGKNVGEQKHTGYEELDYDFRTDFYADGASLLTIGHQTVDQDDAWRTHKTIYGIAWEGLAVGDDKVHSYDQHRDLTYLKFQTDLPGGLADGAEIVVSRHLQTEDLHRVKKDDKSEKQGFDVTTWGGSLKLDSDSAAGHWVYGADYHRDGVDSYLRKYKTNGTVEKEEIQGPVADDATYDSLGVYAEDTVSILNGGLDIVPGIRHTHSAANAEKVKNPVTGKQMSVFEEWDATVGSLRILYPLSPDRRHVVFAGIAQGFRAPNLSDLTRLDTARSNEIETPSPDLDPEEYVSSEIGLKSRFECLTSQVACYHTVVDGMIIRTPTGRTVDGYVEVTKKNAGKGYIDGVELSARYSFDEAWSVWMSGSLMYGEVDTYPTSDVDLARDYITRLMPPAGEAGVRWQSARARYWLELVSNAAGKADKLSADDRRDTQRIPPGGTPGYAVCHIRTGTQLTKNCKVSMVLENVFDEDYRIHGSGVNEPGRNFVMTAACDF